MPRCNGPPGQHLQKTRDLVQLALSIPHGVVRKPPHVLTGRARRQGLACSVCGRLWASGAGRHEIRASTLSGPGPVGAGLPEGRSKDGSGATGGDFLSTSSSSVRSWRISDANALPLLSWSASFCCHRLHVRPEPVSLAGAGAVAGRKGAGRQGAVEGRQGATWQNDPRAAPSPNTPARGCAATCALAQAAGSGRALEPAACPVQVR